MTPILTLIVQKDILPVVVFVFVELLSSLILIIYRDSFICLVICTENIISIFVLELLYPLIDYPSFLDTLEGLFANPVSYKALTSQSLELSPVNILPVLFPPCDADTNTITNNLALGSPKVGTGFAQ